MMSRISFIAKRVCANLASSGSTLYVYWDITTGVVDPGTGSLQGGASYLMSGSMKVFAMEEPARSVVRQFTEIKAGDVICDISPDASICIIPNQPLSGLTSLDELAYNNVKFGWQGKMYEQCQVGDTLQTIFDAVFEDTKLHRTIVLRLAT